MQSQTNHMAPPNRQKQSVIALALRYQSIAWWSVVYLLISIICLFSEHQIPWLHTLSSWGLGVVILVGLFWLLSRFYLWLASHYKGNVKQERNRRALTVLFAVCVGVHLGMIQLAVFLNVFESVIIQWIKFIRVLWL